MQVGNKYVLSRVSSKGERVTVKVQCTQKGGQNEQFDQVKILECVNDNILLQFQNGHTLNFFIKDTEKKGYFSEGHSRVFDIN